MTSRFEGKVAFVTGAASGIGRAVVERLKREGAHVGAFDRDHGRLRALALELGVLALEGDLTDPPSINAAIQALARDGGGLDVVVNAAGVAFSDNVETIQDSAWAMTLAVNLTGAMLVCRAAIPYLKARGSGAIVNVASVAAFNASPGNGSYSASKAGLIALTRNIAYSLGLDGIRCNAICPGWVRTAMSEVEMALIAKQYGTTSEAEFEKLAAGTPLGRVAKPSELAACIAFLASDDASFVTGATLVADGGGRLPAGSRAF